jgi:hypothetical protein
MIKTLPQDIWILVAQDLGFVSIQALLVVGIVMPRNLRPKTDRFIMFFFRCANLFAKS